ncbi:DUF397 domain-containing protein [Streptomyces sp. NPDC015220]|uniref:DUF397 domain-containing protein n=1 Tax=Streptomyces sp. NPDC015220 TaxID=3364947 RepID=UPI003702E5FD
MNAAPIPVQLSAANWLKSSYSAANNECVEVADLRSQIAVRDSKATDRGVLALSPVVFAAFVRGITQSGPGRLS